MEKWWIVRKRRVEGAGEEMNTPTLDSSKCLLPQMDDSLRTNLNFRTFRIN